MTGAWVFVKRLFLKVLREMPYRCNQALMSDAKSPMSREERLAARLRENLKRRKAQARALGSAGDANGESLDSLETGLSNPAS